MTTMKMRAKTTRFIDHRSSTRPKPTDSPPWAYYFRK